MPHAPWYSRMSTACLMGRQDHAKALVGEAWEHPELVFPSEVGSLMDPNNFGRTWNSAVKKAGVPRARLYDARHMHLSMLVANGVDIRTVADRAGHSHTVLSMRLYAHALEAQRKRAAIPLDDLLGD